MLHYNEAALQNISDKNRTRTGQQTVSGSMTANTLEWGRCGDGFSELAGGGQQLPGSVYKYTQDFSRKRGQHGAFKNPQTHQDEIPEITSEEDYDGSIEEDINWNSSDNESPSETSITIKSPPRKKSKKKARPQSLSIPAEDVEISDSDSEKKETKVHNNTEGVKQDHTVSHVSIKTGQSMDSAIDDFDSGDELHQQPSTQGKHDSPSTSGTPKMVVTSPSIMASSSPSMTICSSQSGTTRLRASEWVKQLQMTTPTKDADFNKDYPNMEVDSAKKKKQKYINGGIAEQLSRLQARERSSVRMWTHQQDSQSSSSSGDSKSLTVKLENFELLFSMHLARCTIVDKTEVLLDRGGEQKSLLVLFSTHLSAELEIQSGSIIKIFPPWQQLDLRQSGETVLLCTHYCQAVRQDNGEMVKQDLGTYLFLGISPNVDNDSEQFTPSAFGDAKKQGPGSPPVTAVWNCPCSSGLSMKHSSCPAYQYPCVSGLILQQNSAVDDPLTCVLDRCTEASALHTVTATQKPGHMAGSSLMESINTASRRFNKTICFQGVIQRIICNPSSQSCMLLVEDGHGVMCKIQLPDCSIPQVDLRSILQGGEGQCFMFTGLKIVTRTNRDREPTLFSLIDVAWAGSQMAVSQDSETSQETPMSKSISPPGFCYILTPDDGSTETLSITRAGDIGITYCKPVITNIHKIIKNFHSGRYTVVAKVIFVPDLLSQGEANPRDRLVYVTDLSLLGSPDKYVIIRVQHSCPLTDSTNQVLVFKDIMADSDGSLYADGFSRITEVSDVTVGEYGDLESELHDRLKNVSISLAPIKADSYTNSLVTVKGVIVGVDENSAYSWEACESCGSDRLQKMRGTREITCLKCNKAVRNPEIRMKMEIHVQCSADSSEIQVKVNLLQSTIQFLLPGETDDEGYELSSVLQKPVGPLNCVVVHGHNLKPGLKEEIIVDEIHLM